MTTKTMSEQLEAIRPSMIALLTWRLIFFINELASQVNSGSCSGFTKSEEKMRRIGW